MIKQTVKYENFEGKEQTEELYFNLTKSEIVDMEMSESGSISERLKRIGASNDARAAYREIRAIVLAAYGVKSEDGQRFIKSETLREDFEHSAAFDEFFYDLFTDQDKIVNFINGLIPRKGLQEALDAQEKRRIELGEEKSEEQKAAERLLEETKQAHPEKPKGENKGTFGQPVEGEVTTQEKQDQMSEEEMRKKLKEAGLLDN